MFSATLGLWSLFRRVNRALLTIVITTFVSEIKYWIELNWIILRVVATYYTFINSQEICGQLVITNLWFLLPNLLTKRSYPVMHFIAMHQSNSLSPELPSFWKPHPHIREARWCRAVDASASDLSSEARLCRAASVVRLCNTSIVKPYIHKRGLFLHARVILTSYNQLLYSKL